MKPFVFALFLAAPFFAFAGSAHKSISAQISVLGENMPSEFAIGQAMEAEFYFDEQAESSVFLGYQYSNLITDFSLSVASRDSILNPPPRLPRYPIIRRTACFP